MSAQIVYTCEYMRHFLSFLFFFSFLFLFFLNSFLLFPSFFRPSEKRAFRDLVAGPATPLAVI